MAGQASGSRGILIVCILLGDVWADAPPLVEIASPRDGSTLCEGDPLPFLVRLGKGAIPRGAYAEVLLDSKRVATLNGDDDEEFRALNEEPMLPGRHRVEVSLFADGRGRTGTPHVSLFTVSARGDCLMDERHASTSCVADPGRTRAWGGGLLIASVGAEATFFVRPLDAHGRPVVADDCGGRHEILVTIVPGPMHHRMEVAPDGGYVCRWTPETAGPVEIDIRVGRAQEPIAGSPFDVRARPAYAVDVASRFEPPPWEFGGRMLHTSRERRAHVADEAHGVPLVDGGGDAEIDKLCAGSGEEGRGCAYATMITDNGYLTGALALLFSVRRTGCKLPFVAMTTSDGVSSRTRKALEDAGMAIHVVERMRKTDISDMSEARWNDNYTKLRLWQLPFRKLVFMDSDMVVLQPIRHLFAIPEPFAAVPDAFHPIYLNTGFMVLSPNEGTFNGLASLIDSVSSEESEQTLVNHWFLSRWRPLSYTYNFAKHSVVSPTRHEIFVNRYMDQVKVVHYLGAKPWMCSIERDCMRHVEYYSGDANNYLYDLWWAVLDDMCNSGHVICTRGT